MNESSLPKSNIAGWVVREIKASATVAVWFCLLTCPLVAFKINSMDGTIIYRWSWLLYVGLGVFFLSALWRFMLARRDFRLSQKADLEINDSAVLNSKDFTKNPIGNLFFKWRKAFFILAALLLLYLVFFGFPFKGTPANPSKLLFTLKSEYVRKWIVFVAICGIFLFSAIWIKLTGGDKSPSKIETANVKGPESTWVDDFFTSRWRNPALAALLTFLLPMTWWGNDYIVNVMITALIYITLGLGLNVVVGVSGLLNLGYVAFYAIGAYTYALLNHYFGLNFWICLPLGALTATFCGLLLGFPILRLKGDYLAIVTLGFGEIVRLLLTNFGVTMGPRGISNINRPGFFGIDLSFSQNIAFIFYIMIAVVVVTIVAVYRLENSRLGRAWLAMREDEVACQAMGIDRIKAKLTAFALGATWAGLAGVVFASQVTFINPSSFTFMQSVMILSIVVLGGMGSIPGVIIGALVLIILPEYLRTFSDYRMLIFGGLMVTMMVFRPGGLIQSVRQAYIYKPDQAEDSRGEGGRHG